MTKDVFVSISAMHEEIAETPAVERDEAEAIEVVTPGSYYFRNEKHYIVYDEVMEGFEEATKNIFKFDGSCLEVTKRGAVNVHMLFEEQKKNMTTYHTPFGDILIGIDTEKIEVSEEENKIHLHVDYSLEANYQHLANCKIDMKIYPKKEGAKLFT